MSIENVVEWLLLPIFGWLIYKAIESSNWQSKADEKLLNSEKADESLNLNLNQMQEVIIRLDKIISIHEEKHKVSENWRLRVEKKMEKMEREKNANNN